MKTPDKFTTEHTAASRNQITGNLTARTLRTISQQDRKGHKD